MPRTVDRQRAVEAIHRLCRSGLDPRAFRQELLVPLRKAVPFDGCALVLCDPATEVATSFLLEGSDVAYVPDVIRNELLEDDVNKFNDLAHSLWPVGILSQATGRRRDSSARYRDILRPQGKHDELRVACVAGGARWGSLTLDRQGLSPDFEDTDAATLAAVAGRIGAAFRRGVLAVTADVSSADNGAGVILLDSLDRIQEITPAGSYWLTELTEGGLLPGVVHQAATCARMCAHTEAAGPSARLRAITHSGRWVVVHGSRLSGLDGRQGRVALVIEAAAPAETASMMLDAFELSQREREVALLLLAGSATKEIARRLTLSVYTVQDHLKAIFEKAGVHSRAALAARVLGPVGVDPQTVDSEVTNRGSRDDQ